MITLPEEYLACVRESEMKGMSHDRAQRMCAIAYYKKHGKTVREAAHEKGMNMDHNEKQMYMADYPEGIEKALEVEKAVWTTAYVNDLPDSSFAYISPGGEKDEDGKTVPRSLRHLPYKDKDGKPDAAHVRNALARLNQTDIPASAKASARSKLVSAAKSLGVEVSAKSEILVEGDLLKIYSPFSIQKSDSDECIVEGYITTDSLDSQGEVIEKEASYRAAEEWASIGNIREMHQPSAVGKKLWMEKRDRGVYISAKIVDPIAKLKVHEGVYTMFSVGGKVLERQENRIRAYRMTEVSLVDRGANPDSSFLVVKMDDYTASSAGAVSKGGMMEEKANVPPSQPASASSPEVVTKADYDKVDAELKKANGRIVELEKEVELKKKEDNVKEMLSKAIAELQPEMKKLYEQKPQLDQGQVLKETLMKMSPGELMGLMLKLDKKE